MEIKSDHMLCGIADMFRWCLYVESRRWGYGNVVRSTVWHLHEYFLSI